MDLVTLIMACALNVEPKLMHALIFDSNPAVSRGRFQRRARVMRGYCQRFRTLFAKHEQCVPRPVEYASDWQDCQLIHARSPL